MKERLKDQSIARHLGGLKSYETLSEGEQEGVRPCNNVAKSNKQKIKQMKTSANKKITSFKTHISEFCRNTFSAKEKDDKTPRQKASEEVNSSPNGISSALRSLESVGARIKSSRSLQSLELATSDSLRNVRDRTSDLGENMKRSRYGSQLSIAMGRYEQLDSKDDLDSYALDWRK